MMIDKTLDKTFDTLPPTLGSVIDVLEGLYDPAWARDWDRVGLVCGDPSLPVRRILLAVDPVASVVSEALEWHADLLLTHHPLLLRPVHSIATTTAKGQLVHRLVRGGCALYTAHTNADVAAPGVSDALARVLGLTDLRPLVADTGGEGVNGAGARGIGRIGRLTAPTTLREFAMLVAEALPAATQGVRVAGEPGGLVQTVAVCGGSGDDLVDAVRAAGVDAFVTADLRHHPASELREEVGDGTPYLIDVSHWSSEWPWLAGVANKLEGLLEAAGTPVEVQVSARCSDPWLFRVPSPGGIVR
jgi:dinuclear metal center YbgI/SA1388 family protein